MRPAVPAVLALAGALLLGGCASGTGPQLGGPTPARLTTRGVGTVTGAPDTLTVVLGVTTRAASAADALSDDNARTGALLDVLRGRGVAERDLRTSGLSVAPTTAPDGRVTGYEVTDEVTATLRDLAGAGALVDAAARSVGDAVRIEQIRFGIADDAAPRARARADAVGQAQAQARQLADAAHVALGPIVSITEGNADVSPAPAARDSAGVAAAAVPIAPGTQDVSVTVEVVHALGP